MVESGSEATHKAAQKAEILSLSRIAWAEFHAALARRARTVSADEPALLQASDALAAQWPNYLILEVSQPIVELSGEYAELYALRAYDAVQLATASYLARQSAKSVQFGCFDRRLNKTAAALGMHCI